MSDAATRTENKNKLESKQNEANECERRNRTTKQKTKEKKKETEKKTKQKKNTREMKAAGKKWHLQKRKITFTYETKPNFIPTRPSGKHRKFVF